MLVLEWKERAFVEKVNSRCFCWFWMSYWCTITAHPIWRLHTKLYKCAWNASANNSKTVGHKDRRIGQIVYISVFYNISFPWLLSLGGFQFIFFVAWQWNDLYQSLRTPFDQINYKRKTHLKTTACYADKHIQNIWKKYTHETLLKDTILITYRWASNFNHAFPSSKIVFIYVPERIGCPVDHVEL